MRVTSATHNNSDDHETLDGHSWVDALLEIVALQVFRTLVFAF